MRGVQNTNNQQRTKNKQKHTKQALGTCVFVEKAKHPKPTYVDVFWFWCFFLAPIALHFIRRHLLPALLPQSPVPSSFGLGLARCSLLEYIGSK
jgi:hypothetical protein